MSPAPPILARRRFLRGAAGALALPLLPSLLPKGTLAPPSAHAKRLVCVGTLLGFYKQEFFASNASARLLRPLFDAGLAGHFTTVSGLDHKGPTGRGHDLAHTVFTGSAVPGSSLDQVAAAHLGHATRHESLQLVAGESQPRPILAFTASGLPLPATRHPSVLYAQIFGAGEVEQAHQARTLAAGRSLLDDTRADARRLGRRASREDAERLSEYLEAVRGLEQRLARRADWLDRDHPAPPPGLEVPASLPVDGSRLLETEDLMWDLLALALVNDSTRVASLCIPFSFRPLVRDGVAMDKSYHAYSHHGHDPARIDALLGIEEHHMRGLARFLTTLRDTPDPSGAGSLLDSTVVLLGSAMGDAAAHRRVNFPLLVAGGGFRHRGHLSCGGPDAPNEMACDLFVSVLHRLGIEADAFGSSASNLDAELGA